VKEEHKNFREESDHAAKGIDRPMPLEINRDIDNDAKGTFMAKGILFTIILLVVAVPILLGTIMIRSFFASNESTSPKQSQNHIKTETP
jgi:hypothetical protein